MESAKFYKGKETACDCGHIAISDGFATGYGIDKDGKKICFACCSELDKKKLIETGKLSGYYAKDKNGKYCFTNWPGTLKLYPYYSRSSWHNMAGKNGRTDFWIEFEGHNYHGLYIGFTHQCATIKRTKK